MNTFSADQLVIDIRTAVLHAGGDHDDADEAAQRVIAAFRKGGANAARNTFNDIVESECR